MPYESEAGVFLAVLEVYDQQQGTDVGDPLNQVLKSQVLKLSLVDLKQLKTTETSTFIHVTTLLTHCYTSLHPQLPKVKGNNRQKRSEKFEVALVLKGLFWKF